MQVINARDIKVVDSTEVELTVEGHGVFTLLETEDGLHVLLKDVPTRKVQSMTIEAQAANEVVISSKVRPA